MSQCEHMDKCPFFKDEMPGARFFTNLMKEQFCRGDKSRCARYLVSDASLPVPDDLFPAEYERAVKICEERNKE